MNTKITIFILVLFFTLTACVKDHIEPGDIETELRTTSSYDRVVLEGSMDLIIVQDSTFDIKVVAGENKMPFIKTKVSGTTLRIYESNNHVQSTNQDKIYISKSFLNSIKLEGSGDIEGSGLIGEDIDITLEGSGDITLDMDMGDKANCDIDGSGDMVLTGAMNVLDLEIDGSGSLDARHIPVSYAILTINGSGEARVQAIDLLDVHIHGSGNVYYVGSPASIVVDIDGSGGVGPL